MSPPVTRVSQVRTMAGGWVLTRHPVSVAPGLGGRGGAVLWPHEEAEMEDGG